MKLLRFNGFFSHWHLSVTFIHLILVQESTGHFGTSIQNFQGNITYFLFSSSFPRTIDTIYTIANRDMKSLYKKDELRKVRKKHGLSLILLHGSRVVGSLHKQSDTDIAVVREKEMKKVDLLNPLSDLKRVFEVEKIDVVDLT